jgi:Ser/Thr protein kinase RdoA (MazF antagonist)
MPDQTAARLALLAVAWRGVQGTDTPALAPAAGGSESVPWRVAAPAGRFVLRRYGRGDAAAERATLALAAAGAADRYGLAVPRPVPTDAGAAFHVDSDGEVWTLVGWVSGRPRRTWLGLAGEDAHRLGRALAALHTALRSLPPDLAGPADGETIARHGRPQDQVLHGDPSQGNVLWRGGGAGAGVGFIDFDRADRGPVERDLGRALVGMAPWAGAGSTAVVAAFLAGYAAAGGRPSTARLRRAIPEALAEGEAWIERADLSPEARRAARRWLERARAVALEPSVFGQPRGGPAHVAR